MDKHCFNSNQQTSCCEKVYAAVRNTSPLIQTVRFTRQQHPVNRTTASPAKVSLMTPTPLSDRCVRVPRVEAVFMEASPNASSMATNHKDCCPRIPKQPVKPPTADTKTEAEKVAVMQQQHKANHPHVSVRTTNQVKPKATTLPIDGHENRFPPYVGGPNSYIAQSINGMSSEYIERAGRKIRSPTNVVVRQPSIAPDSFNDRVSNFIDITKNKFHNALSFNEGTQGKAKRLQ